MSLHILVVRKKLSLQYLRNPSKPPDWGNNDANNSGDTWALLDGDTLLFSGPVQTVANLEGLDPGVKFTDTIAPGTFQLRYQVEQRDFQCQPNGLCLCRTMAGDWIDLNSVTPSNPSRWLNHDWEFPRSSGKPAGQDTRVAWSAGCFVQPDLDLRKCNAILAQRGVKPGDMIPGVLEEVE